MSDLAKAPTSLSRRIAYTTQLTTSVALEAALSRIIFFVPSSLLLSSSRSRFIFASEPTIDATWQTGSAFVSRLASVTTYARANSSQKCRLAKSRSELRTSLRQRKGVGKEGRNKGRELRSSPARPRPRIASRARLPRSARVQGGATGQPGASERYCAPPCAKSPGYRFFDQSPADSRPHPLPSLPFLRERCTVAAAAQ